MSATGEPKIPRSFDARRLILKLDNERSQGNRSWLFGHVCLHNWFDFDLLF